MDIHPSIWKSVLRCPNLEYASENSHITGIPPWIKLPSIPHLRLSCHSKQFSHRIGWGEKHQPETAWNLYTAYRAVKREKFPSVFPTTYQKHLHKSQKKMLGHPSSTKKKTGGLNLHHLWIFPSCWQAMDVYGRSTTPLHHTDKQFGHLRSPISRSRSENPVSHG